MRLSLLVAIVLRLFALWWLVCAATSSLTTLGMLRSPVTRSGTDNLWLFWSVPAAYLIAAACAWFTASRLSRWLVGAPDAPLAMPNITAANLYSLAALGVGLTFALGNLAPMFNWLHFLALRSSYPPSAPNLYEFSNHLVPFLAGSLTAACATKIGSLMARG